MKRVFFIGIFLTFSISFFNNSVLYPKELDSSEYVKKAWEASGKLDFESVDRITSECISKYQDQADQLAQGLKDFPPKGEESAYKVMNDIATCIFIKGEALVKKMHILLDEGKNKEAYKIKEEAVKIFKELIKKYPFAQAWDPRGWWWSIKQASESTLKKLEKGVLEEEEEGPSVITQIVLNDPGKEFVDYQDYGEFIDEGKETYRYVIKDPEGLMQAVGEGVYPNTSSVKFDPRFQKISRSEDFKKKSHWKLLNSRDLETAFYKWCTCPEPWSVKQFFIADLLERSKLYNQAIKAYYAVVVHFPKSYGWTYWHTPWYIGRASMSRIRYLVKRHPELGLEYEGYDIRVKGGFDNKIYNDIFIVSPGRLKKTSLLEKIIGAGCGRELGKKVKVIGKGRIRLVKYKSGDWQLFVEGKPFMVKAITYAPTRVGESPDNGTLKNWMEYDYNKNGVLDIFEVWIDENRNNVKDPQEKTTTDFKILKDMGVNAIRLYHHPFSLDKKLLRKIYNEYGIFVIMGDFLGKYALGSGADWYKGTDYDNPQHQKNMMESVKKMILEFKDEPYILAWVLGNENVYGIACNADKNPASFFKFANRVAKMIKKLDPHHPVILCNGDTLYLDLFGKYCPDIDIFGTNAYRGKYGFGFLWQDVKEYADKPVIITEYGCPAYGRSYTPQEAEDFQAEYHRGSWEDIMENSCGQGYGNALGGIIFEYLDEWWKAYEPYYHDKRGLFNGPFLDGYMHEEWLGLVGQGNGKNSPYQRVLRKAYFTMKEMWTKRR